ncbi:uncharacterized protein LOC126831129 [Patella vulgata]|uniref:uncharacterized protein LOC126831129 n=1 Tax=Patella vulgata TaxID=6465 RepID=UPI0024A8B7D8|nr:uncharacterized protein LOC126831129 [Patella vulgata]
MNIDDKRRFVQESRLCFNCLTYGHRAGFCRKRINCDICKGHHATILHQQNPIPQATSCFTNEGKLKSSKIGQPFIFGKIRNGGKLLPAIGLYDSGSNGTFVTSTALSKVGITGKSTELGLTTLCKENDSVNSLVTDVEFLSQDEEHLTVLNSVYSLPSLPISTADIPTQEDIDSWPHLKGITVPKLVPGQEVDLLIGNDNSVIFEPLEIRHSQNNGPFAVRTKFGWLINGPFGKNASQQRTCNFMRKDVELNQQFEQFCNYEFNDSIDDTLVTMSREDSKALSVFEQSINLVDGHYEVSLPWKHDQLQLPNPRIMAEHRLMLLKRRFLKDAVLFEKYSEIINELLSKKYAEVVPPGHIDRANDRVWYLPHHPVVNTKKPGKLRVVFDCAAKFKGVALNDVLLKGPDLTSSLVGVLLRFRQGYYALMGDVESMFHQVNVPQDERDVFRFLWWQSNDVNGELIELRMRVHLFGATSSPSVCNFTLRRTAEDNCEAFDSEVVETVQKNFYVDDCLKSLDDENEAISLVDNLRKLLLKGGFNLTKWVSNSRNIIKSISETERAKTVKNLDFDGLPIERALGVLWDTESDCFTFNVVLKEKPISRRGILSILSSVYDPLGFVAPFVLNAKLILQELCRLKLGWDNKIPDEYEKLWLSWMEDLPLLSNLQVSRCLKPPPSCARVVSVQLHCFSDASQQGYGAVSYLRFIDDAGNVCCSFATGKSRVSPLKSISIPRLELSAAVVSVRLNKIITRELQMKIDKSFYWTDSTSVLKYVNNQDKRFHTFVGNRISTILDGSQPSQWKYVESARNPADEASRGVAAKTILGGSKWISGPDFLWKDELEWPSQPHEYVIQDTDPEVRIEKHSRFVIKGDNSLLDQLVKRFSSWYKLKRCVAWILRYREILKARCQGNQAGRDVKKLQEPSRLTVVELTAAETEILKLVHKTSFPEEYAVLSKKDENGRVSRKSPIFKLDPVLIGGLIRVGGRLRRHNGLFDTKHQIILPKRNPVTELVIRHYHEMLAHSGREYCLSSIRRRFWPINGNSAVRRVLSDCYNCRRRNAPVCNQRMADLPKERVTPDLPPFSYIGIDCFGPFFVKRGRSQLKRYGCIFTCLSCRAVHLEVLHSMDTDSFLNAFRRFICRRGSPLKIRSDNGGNFVAGSKEIKGSIEEWNRKQVDDFMLQREIEWCFNPPAGSHFGGIWERCIRSVRKILDSLLNEQVLCDESLNTLFCEVEMIINGRPLTKVSDDPNDQEALTPNHLMLLRAAGSYPPGLFVERDLYVRNRWRQVQYLANVFWRRWTREYLPLLQVRQKWNEKQRNLVIGDVILLADKDQPRGSWPLGRVVEVYPDDQGTVRVVKLLTKDCKSLCRPVDKCVLLEIASD